MANITYLLGAGASANALPVINEITSRLMGFKQEIDFFYSKWKDTTYGNQTELAKTLSEQLAWLIEKTGSHQTIDTFARKLFAKDSSHKDLKRLKILLSVYFIYEQIPFNSIIRNTNGKDEQKESPDKRYDSLIASIIQNEVNNTNLLGNVKILSWNYDVQFELAFKNFWELRDLNYTHQPLQIIPGKWIYNKTDKLIDINKFSLIHLNGVAGYRNIIEGSGKTIIDDYFDTKFEKENYVLKIIRFFGELNNPYENDTYHETIDYFNYAWEYFIDRHDFKGAFVESAISNAVNVAKNTDVLVIIGYSFPIFNRPIDKMIIDSMDKLQKVYIQDKFPDQIYTTIKNAFKIFQTELFDETTIVGKSRIVKSNSLNQFVLPYEL